MDLRLLSSSERKGRGEGSGGSGLLRSGGGIGFPLGSIFFFWVDCRIVKLAERGEYEEYSPSSCLVLLVFWSKA